MNENFYSLLEFLKDEDESVRGFARTKISEMADEDFSLVETLIRTKVHSVLNSADRNLFSYQNDDCFSSSVRLRVDEETGEHRASVALSVIPPDADSQFDISAISDIIKITFVEAGLSEIVDDIAINGERASVI